MNILSVQNLSKTHGIKQLFSEISFGVEHDDRIGVIGANGSGKSTMLKVIAGAEPADGGQVTVRQGIRVEYAPQNPDFDAGHSVIDHVFASQSDLSRAMRDYESLCEKMEAHPDEDTQKRLADAMARLDALQGWEYETRARMVLDKLGVRDLHAPMGSLSGGYRKRVTLARALLAEADLLILDEPTNHLDADTVAWLEEYLNRWNGALLLVTHDRYFLDRVTRRIIELDAGRLFAYEGNFQYYMQKKAEQAAADVRADERRNSILRKELEWLGRGARARRTHEKHRIERIRDMQAVEGVKKAEAVKFESGGRRIGRKTVEIEGLTKSLGGKLLIKDFSYVMAPGERMGILGPNGAGKSTLVNLITGRLAPDAGEVVIGETIEFGLFDQENADLDVNEKAIDYVKRDGGELLKNADGSTLSAERMMERFLFTSQMLYQQIGKLSGGERRRLHLVRTLMKDPNFLILDEPTNDLDIPTLQALEDYLDTFAGCLLVVSHDRYFLDRTVTHLLALEGEGRYRIHHGDYDTYHCDRAARMAALEDAQKPAKAKPAPLAESPQSAVPAESAAPERKKLSYKEQRELEELEKNIEKWEQRLTDIEPEIAAAATDYSLLQQLTSEQTDLQSRLDTGVERWQELAERA